MSKALTIVAIVGSLIFGAWYFNKNGCQTDIEALCWNGPSIEEMLSGTTGGAGPEEDSSIVDQAAGLEPDADQAAKLQQNIRNMRKPQPKLGLKSRFGPGANPYTSNLSYALAAQLENQITVA